MRPRPPAPDLLQTIAEYGAGLSAEIALLRQLDRLSRRQHQASKGDDMAAMSGVTSERERLLASLVTLEEQLRPQRAVLAANVASARLTPGFADVLARHREAGALVSTIMSTDRTTLEQLRSAEQRRRDTAHALETGEATLAAYRRVVAPALSSVGLLDRRG